MAIVGTDAKREAGRRLKAWVLDRMGQQGIGSLVELAERAPVSYDTLHAWFRGRAPDPGTGGRVALVLGATYSEMLAVYEGRPLRGAVIDDDLRAMIEAAAERAVRRVLGDRDGRGPA